METPKPAASRILVAEFLGTTFLLMAVIGSWVMGERLAPGQEGLILLVNALVTGFALLALITVMGPVSGAMFNPAVSFILAWRGDLAWSLAARSALAQVAGAVGGVGLAHLMFGMDPFSLSTKARTGPHLLLGEFLATFGLLMIIRGLRGRSWFEIGAVVGAYIAGAYWFTSSTSFANPAAAIARCLTPSGPGIHPMDVPAFIVAQCAGAWAGMSVSGWLWGDGSNRRAI